MPYRLSASCLALALALGCSHAQDPVGRGPAPALASSTEGRHAALDEILRKHVRGERVDYLSLRSQDWGALVSYLSRMAAVDVEALSEPQQLALYLNVYNAAMIKAIIERFRADYSPSEKEFGVFDEKLVQLGGEPLSLNHLEHEVIRKRFDEPRIHTALVCGARSCPPLLPRAYRAEDLDAVLEANMRRFVRDGERNRIDHRARKMQLSQIFNWFAADFGGAAGVPGYVARHAEGEGVASFRVEFLEYSWLLNAAPPGDGRWVELRRDARGLPAGLAGGSVLQVAGEVDGMLELVRPFGQSSVMVPVAATRSYRG